MKNALIFIFLVLAFQTIGHVSIAVAEAEVKTERLVIKTADQVLELDVEVANDSAERSKGLMHRKKLLPMQGMLFDFNRDKHISMWMKNTEIHLDMFFVDAKGEILYIKEEAEPHSLDVVSYNGSARAVLEMNGGFAKENSIQVGDVLYHPLFENELLPE